MPLDPYLIEEDIKNVRGRVDFVVLSFHWGIENKQYTHPEARRIAHAAIDAGADVIIGHHPHVPQGIEVYKDKVILYSLGNFIFGHNHDYWMDNILARITLSKEKIEKIEIIPISGIGRNLTQPNVLTGNTANLLLSNIKKHSEALNTKLIINGDVGIISGKIKPDFQDASVSASFKYTNMMILLFFISSFLIALIYVIKVRKTKRNT